MISCLPQTSCLPFRDPDTNPDESFLLMRERCLAEKDQKIVPATDESCEERHLRHFLRLNLWHVESALTMWRNWVKWRHRKLNLVTTDCGYVILCSEVVLDKILAIAP